MSETTQPLIGDGKLVLIALVAGLAAFAVAFVFISGGAVRHVDIFLPEKTYVTLIFQNIEGTVAVVGTDGIAGVNPTILMRTGDFALELTVTNEDSEPHRFYIDGLDVSTGLLLPGQSRVLTLYSEGEGTYDYYIDGSDQASSYIKAVRVTMYE